MKLPAASIAASIEYMLEANKSAWFERIFAVYNLNLLKRRFHSFHISNLDLLVKNKPTIIFANHSSWWDGLAAFQISQLIKADSFIMMEERQLRKLRLFRRLGAFSVVRENPRLAVKSLHYAINLLKENPARTLWIFPQVEILPNDSRPIKFYAGLSRIIENLKSCTVVSLAIRYEFLDEYKPEVFVKINDPEIFNQNNLINYKDLNKHFEKNLTDALDELKQDIALKKTEQYNKIF